MSRRAAPGAPGWALSHITGTAQWAVPVFSARSIKVRSVSFDADMSPAPGSRRFT
jgi:hypothetical protein